MSAIVIVGAQWGDEGKGKIIDFLAKDYDYIVRFNGGDNAGHTVKVGDKKFGLHLIPSGVMYPEKWKVIGNGVAINPETLINEIQTVESAGFPLNKLAISNRAHVIMPWHKLEDGGNELGTTKRGIGPAYADKANRTTAIRVADLLDENVVKEKLSAIIPKKVSLLNSLGIQSNLSVIETFKLCLEYKEKLAPYIADTAVMLNQALAEGKKILLEGAQGTMLDVDHGSYPFVTSSNTTSGGATVGAGIPPSKIDRVIGVAKAYTTRVGGGPFPTELTDDIGEKIREKGQEFGTTTGRPRRCGWLDLVMLKYAKMINGLDELIITKLDVLGGLDEVKVCVAYEIDGKEIQSMPANLEKVSPVYETFKGWKEITGRQLPNEAMDYINFISKEVNIPIKLISVGPDRKDTVTL